jgi:glc operon protein GlcG
VFAANALAQGGPPPYGETINIATAKKVAAVAEAEAAENKLAQCIAVVAPSGDLIYFERLDNCQCASITISQQKARSVGIYRRATQLVAERLAKGGGALVILTLDRAIESGGGAPLLVGGKIIGAIGCGGGSVIRVPRMWGRRQRVEIARPLNIGTTLPGRFPGRV